MAQSPYRIVIDTNTLLRGLVSAHSAAAKVRYRRDASDEKFLELAITLQATHILTSDNDLLSLPTDRSEAGKRFRQRLPGVEVMDAATFMQTNG